MTLKLFAVAAISLGCWACTMQSNARQTPDELHAMACSVRTNAGSPWHIANLYDCDARELFIPYQLWTGAPWDGSKKGPCMHVADTLFHVNGASTTTIRGPEKWQNPLTGDMETIWRRNKTSGWKSQYFTCHELGIGRVYDSRGPRYYPRGRCKFPAGFGWHPGIKRHCASTSIEIVLVDLNPDMTLRALEFKWWYGSTLDHAYRYAPNKGMTHAWPQ